ncbi:MAG: heavy-metal-associated domain-containing protein [Desulfobacterales bacterium]|jgi:copper chaperone CopZ|nr:heavy-metal-associated domain-containing protein [Desulfobacterales bacterium]
MTRKTFSIPKISCGHCVMAIRNELAEIPGIRKVEGSPAGKTIEVEWEAPATEERIRAVLSEIDYPAA